MSIAPRPRSLAERMGTLLRSPTGVAGVLAGILLLGLWVRVRSLGAADLWGDEAVSWDVARESLPGLLGAVAEKEAKPPVYFLALHAWMKMFGDGEVSLRSLSVVFWPPLGAMIFLLGRRLCGNWAWLPVFLTALSPLLIYYGIEARPYSMHSLAEAIFLWLALRADEERSTAAWVRLAGGTLGVLLVQVTGIFFVAPVLLAVLLPRRKNPRALAQILLPQAAAVALAGGVLVFCSPGLIGHLGTLSNSWWASFPSGVQIASAPARLLAPVQSWKPLIDGFRPLGLLLLASTALLLAMAAIGCLCSEKRLLLGWAGFGAVALVALYSVWRANMLFERYYIGCAPVLLLGVGCALQALEARRPALARGMASAACVAQIALFALLPAFAGAIRYREPVEALLSADKGPLTILTSGWDGPSVRYYTRHDHGRVVLSSWSGPASMIPMAPSPLYFLHSNSWGEKSGEVRSAAERTGLTLTAVFSGPQVTVYRLSRPR